MATTTKRIAVNCGGGYTPALNAVVIGVVMAATELGWEVVGIRDGYDGLIEPEAFPDGGVFKLDVGMIEHLDASQGSILGVAPRNDPFRVRTVNVNGFAEEVDRSSELIERIGVAKIDAVISIVGGSAVTGSHALTVAFKLSRKGLRTVCIPKSVENDIAGTVLSFGFNSALSYAAETLERIRTIARDARRIAVVETPGHHAGWLALQSGLAARADAILIPEIPFDPAKVAAALRARENAGRPPALIVVAEGATGRAGQADAPREAPSEALRKSLSPLADPSFGEGARAIERSGLLGERVALNLQRLMDRETFPMSLGQLVRSGAPTAVDRQLALGYGAAAVRALSTGEGGVMVAFQPPDLKFVPLAEAINKVRTVPPDSEFVRIVRALGISLGD
jgi:ATP-dependent phosphofructokinase / diphosphate-dependent phosphofructokinase